MVPLVFRGSILEAIMHKNFKRLITLALAAMLTTLPAVSYATQPTQISELIPVDLATLEDGRYEATLNVCQEHVDVDSMCAGFILKDNVIVEVEDGQATVTLYIARNPQMNGFTFEDTIGETDYKDEQGNWINVEKTLVQKAIVSDEIDDAWQIQIKTSEPVVYVRAVIEAMGSTNPAFRVILCDVRPSVFCDIDEAFELIEVAHGVKATNEVVAEVLYKLAGFSDEDSLVAEDVTREQLCIALYNLATQLQIDTNVDGTLDSYIDKAAVSADAIDAVTWAMYNGLFGEVTTINPKSTFTTPVFKAVISNFIDYAN